MTPDKGRVAHDPGVGSQMTPVPLLGGGLKHAFFLTLLGDMIYFESASSSVH